MLRFPIFFIPDKVKYWATLIGIIVIAVPYSFGLYVHDHMHRYFQEMSVPGVLSWEPLSFHLGWLRSVGQSRLTITNPFLKEYLGIESIDIDHTLYQGPFLFRSGKGFFFGLAQLDSALSPAALSTLSSLVKTMDEQEHPLLQMRAWWTLSLLGNHRLDFFSPALHITDAIDFASVLLQPFTLKVDWDRLETKNEGLLVLQALQLEGKSQPAPVLRTLSLEGARWVWERAVEEQTQEWLLGNDHFSLDRLHIEGSNAASPFLEITGVSAEDLCSIETQSTEGLLQCIKRFYIEKLHFDQQTWGPIQVAVEGHFIEPQALKHWQSFYAHPQALLEQWPVLEKAFLQYPLEIQIPDCQIHTPYGDIELKAHIHMQTGSAQIEGFIPQNLDPFFALWGWSKEQTQAFVRTLIEAGYLTPAGHRYRVHIDI